jgi:hypothetical protein
MGMGMSRSKVGSFFTFTCDIYCTGQVADGTRRF